MHRVLAPFVLMVLTACGTRSGNGAKQQEGSGGNSGSSGAAGSIADGAVPSQSAEGSVGSPLPDASTSVDASAMSDGEPSDAKTLLKGGPPWDGTIVRTAPVGPFPYPRRILFFYTPHGTVLDAWAPTTFGSPFQPGSILAPITPFMAKVAVVSGLTNYAIPGIAAKTHESAVSVLFTAHLGAASLEPEGYVYSAGGPSLENLIGRIGSGSATLGVNVQATLQAHAPVLATFSGPSQAIAPTYFKLGQALMLPGRPHVDLLMTIARAFGIASMGDSLYQAAVITELLK